jgi:hypothetical protein
MIQRVQKQRSVVCVRLCIYYGTFIYSGNDQSYKLLKTGCSVQLTKFVINSPHRHGDPMQND